MANWTRLVATLATAVFVGCAKSEQANQPADSTARNLTLAPAESTAALRDVPASKAQPAKRAQEKKATAKPRPPERAAPKLSAPAPLATFTAPAGTQVPLAVGDTISTRHVHAGDPFSASVSEDVRDVAGHIIIPAGSPVQGTIDAADARHPNSSGRLVLSVHNVTVRGTGYAVAGTVVSMDTVQQGRGVTTTDAAKVGAGAAAGAILGRIIGKGSKGTVIGGLVGAAGGAAAARTTRDIDIVLPKGARFTLKLDLPLTVQATT
jgi:hypothetical protein